MRTVFFVFIMSMLVACGATTKPPVIVTAKLPDSTKVEMEYITDTSWGLTAKSIGWRIRKDTTVVVGDKVIHTIDSIYYIPVPRNLVDSAGKRIKTKNKLQDSVIIIYVVHPKNFVVTDFGAYEAYIKKH